MKLRDEPDQMRVSTKQTRHATGSCLHAAIIGASENTDAKYTIMPRKMDMGRAGSAFSNWKRRWKTKRHGLEKQELFLTMFNRTKVEHRPKTMAPKVVTTTVMLVDAALQRRVMTRQAATSRDRRAPGH